VVIFPEGTRYTPKKHLESQEFAREKGYPVLDYLLTPKPKGFAFALNQMRNDIEAVYVCTMAFKDNKPPNMVQLLKVCGRLPLNVVLSYEDAMF
jgi:1-acyl-sn-glycerol-3-phosphate acyltransferase